MSTEKIINNNKNDFTVLMSSEANRKPFNRVDINDLLARARKERQKENKINLVFLGLTSALILVVGILLSL